MMNRDILYRRAYHVFFEYKPISFVKKFFEDRMSSALDDFEKAMLKPNDPEKDPAEFYSETYALLELLQKCLAAIELALREGSARTGYIDCEGVPHGILFEKKPLDSMRVTFYTLDI